MSEPAMNPAVLHCLQAWHHAQAAAKPTNPKASDWDKHQAAQEAEKAANQAYCAAMPTFNDLASIFNYIACISHAMLLEIIPQDRASKLLYSAQVALGCLKAITQAETKSAKATHPTQPGCPISPAFGDVGANPAPPPPSPNPAGYPRSIAFGDQAGRIAPVPSPAAPDTPTAPQRTTPLPSKPVTPAASTPANLPTRHGEAANPPNQFPTPANSANSPDTASSATPPPTPSPASIGGKHTTTPQVATDPLIAHATEALRLSFLERKSA